MSGPWKSAPLETYLSGVAPRPEPEETTTPDSAIAPGAVVILTILGHTDGPCSATELAARSELGADRYRQAVADLQSRGLIRSDAAGFVLTDSGREAASRERSRLLSF
jgi:predicted transcriptional regulator